ncbi:NERD domain-containing protein [Bacillus suaedae]|uniref:NERD domain-containing protein n=1 Tax=Halalkalibacter suaedae TaxID=2822140 RepID=A0A940WYL5_9BACI|nr:NERD domain-containing protein [Bacillus suaedae]MBP3953182.1 NERD domain-containing protein [Bacillus suaedae]
MIKKQRDIPLKILKLEALLRRLPFNHSQRPLIEKDWNIRKAGLRGEQSLDYYLKELSPSTHDILHDLRIRHAEDSYFQLDTLIITPHFLLILEVKHISGTLFFDQKFNQLIRTKGGEEEKFLNPLIQLRVQHQRLQHWLLVNKFPKIPIFGLVVSTHPSAVLKANTNDVHNKVIHAECLLDKINDFTNLNQEPIFSKKDITRLAKVLIKQHTSSDFSVLEQYKIAACELQTGVHCPICNRLPLPRKKGIWFCPACLEPDPHAYRSTLNDSYLLFGPAITNEQARHFLDIESRSVTSKLLGSLQLEKIGEKRGSSYKLHLINPGS